VSDDVVCRGYLAQAIQKPLFEAGFGYPNARHPIFLYLSSRKDGFRNAPGKQSTNLPERNQCSRPFT
jgi:hypothetical protein